MRVCQRSACACAVAFLGSFVVGMTLGQGEARAQSTPNVIPSGNGNGFDTHLFRPAMDSKGLFTVNGSDILGNRDFSFGLVLDYANTLLRTPYDDKLIEHSFQGTLQANYGIANQIVVGVDLPV